MSKLATTPERSTDLPGDAILLGVDGEGYDHYLSPYRQTVYILDDDQLDREVDVQGRSLTSYGQWVSQTRGRWAEWYCLENGMADLIDELAAEVTPTPQPGD